jgi:hypothetical protein
LPIIVCAIVKVVNRAGEESRIILPVASVDYVGDASGTQSLDILWGTNISARREPIGDESKVSQGKRSLLTGA